MDQETQIKKNDRRLSRTRVCLLIVALLVLCGSVGAYLYCEVWLPRMEAEEAARVAETKRIAEQNYGNRPLGKWDEKTAPPDVMLEKYAALYEENSDLRGWISVPVFDIELPIMRGIDNEYYLRRSYSKSWSLAGTPFFDYRITDFGTLPRNTVVYGHNMRRNDIMFGVFQNIRTVEGFQKCPVIEVDTIYREYRWFVYAVFIANPYESQDNGYFFPYNFIDTTDQSFEEYIKEIDKRKLYTTGVELTPQDKILTISTCCYDFRYARLVVVARLQRKNETNIPDTSLAVSNPNPKYPQAWYDAKRQTNPFADDSRWFPD